MSIRCCCLFAVLLPLAQPGSAQTAPPLAAPGLMIPSGSLPYALDHFNGQPELVPVHHSSVEVNAHKGANVAGSLAGSVFYKPKTTVELAGLHARTTLHDVLPSFYIHLLEDPDGAGDSPSSETPAFAIVRAQPAKDRRVFAQVRFTQLTGNAKRDDHAIEGSIERLPGGWLKLTPKSPLAAGEYALSPIPKAQNAFSTVLFDFAIDPQAPNATDAIQPTP
jgi:hypothetical protein